MSHSNITWGGKMKNKFKFVLMLVIIVSLIFLSSNIQAKNNPVLKTNRPIRYGLIFGFTVGVFEHANWLLSFTKLEFENRTKISGFYGFYIIGFLEIGKTYSITASKEDYSSDTIKVTLTEEKPIQIINFHLLI